LVREKEKKAFIIFTSFVFLSFQRI